MPTLDRFAVVLTSVVAMGGVVNGALGETVTVTFGPVVGESNAYAGGDTATYLYGDLISNMTYISGDGLFVATELDFQTGGEAPVPDETGLSMYLSGIPVTCALNMALGYEEGRCTIEDLTANQPYTVTLTVGDLDDLGLTWDSLGEDPVLERLVVFAGDSPIGEITAEAGAGEGQWVTASISIMAMSDAFGRLSLGFNQPFLWDPNLPAPEFGDTSGAGGTGALRIEQIVVSSPLTFRVDSAPNSNDVSSWDAWWIAAAGAIGSDLNNMRSGTYPSSFICDPLDCIISGADDAGRQMQWLYRVDGETIADLDGRLELKLVWDWDGVDWTLSGGKEVVDSPDVGWGNPSDWPSDWVDVDGGVVGSMSYAWTATDEADFQAVREDILHHATFLRGLVRYKANETQQWQTTAIESDIIWGHPPGDANGDGLVNIMDLVAVFDQWGTCSDPGGSCSADFNFDGEISVPDLQVLFERWGTGTG